MTDIISEREKTHGDFKEVARISQALKNVMATGHNWFGLTDVQKEALEMDAVKTARILCGDPNYSDHWNDKCGYSGLGSESRLERYAKNSILDTSVYDAYKKTLKEKENPVLIPNVSAWEIIDKEFNARITPLIDRALCEQYGLSEGYFLRLQEAYDNMEDARK